MTEQDINQLNDSELVNQSLMGLIGPEHVAERLLARSSQLNTFTFKMLEVLDWEADEDGNYLIDDLSIDDLFDRLTEKLAWLEHAHELSEL